MNIIQRIGRGIFSSRRNVLKHGRHALGFDVLEDRRVLSASLQIDASAYDNAISPDDPSIAKIGYELASIADLASRSELKTLPDTAVLLAMTRVSEQRNAVLIEAAASGEATLLSRDLASLGMTSMAMAGRMGGEGDILLFRA